MRANSSGVQAVRPARPCSWVDSAVSVCATMALPASSGWARIRPSCSSGVACRTTAARACFSASSVAKGRAAAARSAIQGECS